MLYAHISTNILKWDIKSDDKRGEIYHWLDSFEMFHQKVLLFQHNHPILMFLKRVDISQLGHLHVSLIKKMKQDVI